MLDYSKIRVGTVIKFNNELYYCIPSIPQYAKESPFCIYEPRAVAFSLKDAKKIGHTNVAKSEIYEKQLSETERTSFLMKLKLLGKVDKTIEVDTSYDSMRNVENLESGKIIVLSNSNILQDGFFKYYLKDEKAGYYVALQKQSENVVRIFLCVLLDDIKQYAPIETVDFDFTKEDVTKKSYLTTLLKNKLIIGTYVDSLYQLKVKTIPQNTGYREKVIKHIVRKYNSVKDLNYLNKEKLGFYCLQCLTPEDIRIVIRRYRKMYGPKTIYEYYYKDKLFYTLVDKYKRYEITEELNYLRDFVVNLYGVNPNNDIFELLKQDYPDVDFKGIMEHLKDNTVKMNFARMAI